MPPRAALLLVFASAVVGFAGGCALPGPPRHQQRAPNPSACPTLSVLEASPEGLRLGLSLPPARLDPSAPQVDLPTHLFVLAATTDDPDAQQIRLQIDLSEPPFEAAAFQGGPVYLTDTDWPADAARVESLQVALLYADPLVETRRCVASPVLRPPPTPPWPEAVEEPPLVEAIGRVVEVRLPDVYALDEDPKNARWRLLRRTLKSDDGEDGHLLIVPGWQPTLTDFIYVDVQVRPGNVYAYSLARETLWGKVPLSGPRSPEAYLVLNLPPKLAP